MKPNRTEALKRAGLVGLVEAADALPGVGPLLAGAFYSELTQVSRDLSEEVRQVVKAMAADFEGLLRQEGFDHADQTVAIALAEALAILDEHGLAAAELVETAGLDATQAARRTLEAAAGRLRLLEAEIEVLTRRLVEAYYRVLLDHRDALAHVGVPALRRLLQRTEGLVERFLAVLDIRDWRKAWEVLLPVTRSLPPLTQENLLEALRAPYRLVEFTGKAHRALCEEIMDSLKGLAPDGNRAWVLWGLGGAGKTRTAVEVAQALQAAGWQAFFVPPPILPAAGWAQYLPIWSRPDRPTLLIVDYAEQRPADELRALAQAVREAAAERRFPLALLFLMRANPQEHAAGHLADALKEAWVRYETRMVPPMADPDDRQDLFCKARARFRAELAPSDAPPEVDYDPKALPRTPLALLALAVLAAHGHRVARSESEVEVMKTLWENWEQPRWRRTLEAQGGEELLQTPEVWHEARERIEQALAAASLGRPFTAPEEVAAWWEAHFPFRARTARGERLDPFWLAWRLQALFPTAGETWRLPPISPDPLADVVLARFGRGLARLADSILPAPEEIEAADAAARRLAEEAGGMVILLVDPAGELAALVWPMYMVREIVPRLSDSAAPGAPETARAALEAVTRWLEKTVRALPDEVATAWLGAWDGALPPPDRTLLLRPFEEVVYLTWAGRTTDDAERARALNMLGYARSALGRREEALAATAEAVGHYRRLAEANPAAFLPDLAMSLGAHGTVLRGLGRPGEAVQAFAEGLHAVLPFVRALPAAFGGLAGALLADYLQACGEAKREPERGLVEEVGRGLGGD
jgi:hypothetical protein